MGTRRVWVRAVVSLWVAACGDNDDGSVVSDGGVDGGDAAAPDADAAADVGTDAGPIAPRVDTAEGPVVGQVTAGVLEFLGIPYAADASGPNRWRPPQPVSTWSEPLDATAPGDVCTQVNPLVPGSGATGSEDCLYLNVWTPAADDAARPVMVWIHGGAFVLGSGSDPAYDGASLASTGDVVVVSLNYRLGVFGFFSHAALDAEAGSAGTANWGLLDQRAALEWVQRNVAAFGGDPANVTLFGQSAGGYSVCAHLVSPGSAGLFHRAISESGVCSMPPVPLADAQTNAANLAAALGCSGDVLACLRGVSVDALSGAVSVGREPGGIFYQSDSVEYRPIGDGVVLPADPFAAIAAGDASVVPFLSGSNTDEGTIFHGGFLGMPVTTEEEYRAALGRAFATEADAIAAEYPVADFASPNDALIEVTGDNLFVCAARRFARAMSAAGAPSYLYTFDQAPTGGLFRDQGVFHAAEVVFVFANRTLQFGDVGPHRELSDAIIGYWTRFASTGDPNGGDAVVWPLYETASDRHLVLADPIVAGEHHQQARCDLWDEIVALRAASL